jgi:MoaA/NifB/PqqE/SkfB family radical SAM enzyme
MIVRAKTKNLFEGKPLTDKQRENSDNNISEMESGALILNSLPRRIVLELTNACNLNCMMCGRHAAAFRPTRLELSWFRALEPLLDSVEEVTLMGWGEPTIHPDFEEMLRTIDRHAARKYFCSNGMRLDKLHDALFEHHVDVFAVSVDGATQETNSAIRNGSNLEQINKSLGKIVETKRQLGLKYPYINYVFCAMRRNLHELPAVVEMAAAVGLEEVKVVFLTAFTPELIGETLFGCESEVAEVFGVTAQRAEELGVLLKLPYIRGTDPALQNYHRDCFVGYRDFFLGSDGYVRPCMSTSDKFFQFDPNKNFMEIWNAPEYQKHRQIVNTPQMDAHCKNCYQSSHCNWNNKKSYIQCGEEFAPTWEADK